MVQFATLNPHKTGILRSFGTRVSAFFLLMGMAVFADAQTSIMSSTVANGGFESGTTGWTMVQTASTTTSNKFAVSGASIPAAGTNAAYITTNNTTGIPWGYAVTTARATHMYQDVTFPSGETSIHLSFLWKGAGQSATDQLLVYLAPTSVTPVSGTPASGSTTITGATLLWTQPNNAQFTYTPADITISSAIAGNASSNSTMRLIFTWQNNNATYTEPPASVDNITLTSATCMGAMPTGASSITPTTATLNWSAFSGATSYNIRYKKIGDPASVSTWATPTSVSSSSTSLAVASLLSGSGYEYQVSAAGSSCTQYVASSSFVTPCASVTLPQTEGFNAGTIPAPGCWNFRVLNINGTYPQITYPTTGSNPTCTPYEGTNMIMFNSFSTNTNSQIRLVSLPVSTVSISTSVDVEFYWLNDNTNYTGSGYATEGVQVQYSTDGVTFTDAGSFFPRSDGANSIAQWNKKTVTLPTGANGQTTLYVGFLFTSQFGDHCYMDKVTILKTPTCFTPTGITPSLVTSSTATVSWTAPSGGTSPIGYSYVVSPSSAIPSGSGTSNSTTSVNLSSLSANTTYYAFVRSICGIGDSSLWQGPVSFTTPCNPVNVTQAEGFNTSGAATLPGCWSTATLALGTATTPSITFETSGTNATSTPFEGTRMIKFNSYDCNDGASIRLQSLPVSTAGQSIQAMEVRFYWFNDNTAYLSDTDGVQVQYSLSGGSSWNDVGSFIARQDGPSGSAWNQKIVQLPGATVGVSNMMVGFRFLSSYGNNCFMDTVIIKPVTPNAPTATNAERCGPGNATCSVSSNNSWSTHIYRWYLVSSGGTPISGQSGTSLSGYSVSTTTTFYVAEMNGPEEGVRVPVTMTINTPPNASVTSKTDVTCFNGTNGTATTTVTSGGTSPFSYSWNTTPGQSTATATNLAPGSYICTVTDSKTCTDTATVTINNASSTTIPAITGHPSNSTICAGGNTTFTAAATGLGITYRWYLSTTGIGGTYNALSNGGVYSGALTATLTITGATAGMNGYYYRCVATGTCSPPATSQSALLTVNVTVPSVSISASATTICAGTSVTFTATPTNGGTTPAYQWKRNGINVGTNSTTYVTTTLANGDVVSCQLTSNAACASPAVVNSNNITMTVNPLVTPSVSINASNTSPCAGASVTFTATPTNGGTTPAYQWKKNGTNVGTNSSTYVTNVLATGDVMTCVMTSSAACPSPATATSNAITMNVVALVTPAITISASTTAICPGASVTFTATPTNGGSSPSYQWKVNGNNAGTNSATFTTSTLANGDIVTCELTSSVTCVTTATATSSGIAMTVYPVVIPSVTISANPGSTLCAGDQVLFTATAVNGGTSPQYQWIVNGAPMIGATAFIFGASSLNNGDVVSCVLNSSASCANPAIVSSNSITLTVNPTLPPIVIINASPGNTVKAGDTVTFNALVSNGGTAPTYQWKKNGGAISGATNATYTASDLQTNDQVTLVVYSSLQCADPDSTTSNSIIMIVDNTGIREAKNMLGAITLYPNPNTGQFVIEAKMNAQINSRRAAFEVLNNLGQVITRGEIEIAGGVFKKSIVLNNISDGTYFIRVTVGEERAMKKFVIQR
jgi:hypothetical protein